MIFLEGKSQYLNWSKYGDVELHPHQTEYIVALDNRVYARSCTDDLLCLSEGKVLGMNSVKVSGLLLDYTLMVVRLSQLLKNISIDQKDHQ